MVGVRSGFFAADSRSCRSTQTRAGCCRFTLPSSFFVWPSMPRLTPNWAISTFADLQSTMSNQRWASPLVLSPIPSMPLDSKTRLWGVHSPSCAAISHGILYGCPVLDFRGSVSLSTVQGDDARSRGTACQKACLPVHSRCHCSLSICYTPASHWSLLPPTASIRCLRRLSSRVALAQLVPRCSLSSLALYLVQARPEC